MSTPSAPSRNPPRNAPTMPTMMLRRRPCWASVPMILLPIHPASPPMMTQAIQPTSAPISSIPFSSERQRPAAVRPRPYGFAAPDTHWDDGRHRAVAHEHEHRLFPIHPQPQRLELL